MTSEQYRLVSHSVDHCPHCGQRHDYAVELKPAPLVFGGGSDEARIAVRCPATGKPFQTTIAILASEEFVRVITRSPADSPKQQPQAGEADPQQLGTAPVGAAGSGSAQPSDKAGSAADSDEYTEWVKSSRNTGLDFGKTMLTASSGAVAVYFAVLNYLGTSKISKSISGILGALPPILFLASTAVFAAALRPRLAPLTRRHFQSFKDDRLRQLNRLLLIGTALFVVALAVALSVYIDIMNLI